MHRSELAPRARIVLFSITLLSSAGCVSPPGEIDMDGGRYMREGGPSPVFRECAGEGGVSDASCGEAGMPSMDPDAGNDAGPPPPPCNLVTFEYTDASATSVWVSGSFVADAMGAWPTTPAMGALVLENDGAGHWSLDHLVEPTGRHTYKIIVDGTRWIADPGNPLTEPDGFGGQNSVLEVCSSSCGDLGEFDWRDAVMYFAMVDRFRDSDGRRMEVSGATDGTIASGQYLGGDLAGVTEQLPYLADLGVTALWLSAPYENRNTAGAAIDAASDPRMYSAYHGYWPSPDNVDYSMPSRPTPRPRVESRIGSEGDLRTLVDTLHATTGRDGHTMKILFDYVMKHADSESGLYRAHPEWFVDPVTTCAPDRWDDSYWSTRCSFTTYLPSFDFYQDAPRRWSVDDATWWATEYDLDGFRLDAVKHIPLSWLTDLRDRIDAEVPMPAGQRFYMVGETFDYFSRENLRRFVDPEQMLDGQFDFPFKRELCTAMFRPEGSLAGFSAWMDGNDGFYGPGSLMTTWIGNHDVPRAIHFASRQIGSCTEGSNPGNGWNPAVFTQPTDAAPYERLALAFVVMFTSPGIPLVYYGDEIGLAGGGDPDNRRMMPWEDEGDTLLAPQLALRETVTALGRIRGENPVIGRGRRTTLSATQDTWVYRMTGCGSAGASDVIVAINRADGGNTVSVPAGSYDDLVSGAMESGGALSLGPRSFRILRVR